MNKSLRLTAAFAVVLVVLCAVYFLSSPTQTTPREQLSANLLAGLTSDKVTKVEVVRKDGGPMTFEKASDVVGDYWRIVEQAGHAAEPAMVQQLLFALDRFVTTGGLDPGKPETAPELTGLADPRMTVTYTAAGRREVLRFGKQPPTNTTAVFYQKEGDPRIYLVGVETFDAFTKPALAYRSKNLVRYAAHRINKIALEYKFTRLLEKGKPGVVEYEKSLLERFEEGAERGWYLVSPHKERLHDHSVAILVARLADLPASDYQPVGDLREKGLAEPEVKVALYGAGDAKPVEVYFGAPADRGRKRWVWSPGSEEAALVDANLYDEDIPLQRAKLRIRVIFPFSQELVKHVEIEVKDLGRVVLDRKELKKEGEPVSTWKWEVVEPNNLKVESERLEAFVTAIVTQEIVGFLGAQDFKLAGLDPAPVQLKVTTKEGKDHVCGFFASKAQGFLRKEGVDEIFEVRPELVRLLQRLELNFVSLEMFSVPRDSIKAISFDSPVSAQLQPVYYKLKVEGSKWVFDDPANKGAVPNPDKLGNLLTLLNYIKADALIGRDSKTIETYRLDERTAPATLKLSYEIGQGKDAKAGEMELYISSDISTVETQPKYYARLKDNLAVFQINAQMVLALQKFLKIEDKPDGDK